MRTALPLALALAPILAAALGLGPAALRADAALVLANGDYAALPDLARGGDLAAATRGLSALGFDVEALADGGREDAGRALARFMAAAPGADRLLVALSGRFVTDGARTWFLTADSPVPTLFGLNSNALSVESLLAVLARRPSEAVLLLGRDPEAGGAFDPWLREGVGALAVPQGVTVLAATPEEAAAFLAAELATPGADLAAQVRANPAIRAEGYLPGGFAFLPEAPAADPAPAPAPEPGDPAGAAGAGAAEAQAAEAALWQGALALGTVEALRDYLRAYPQGAHAREAQAAVTAILSEPNREERLTEEALRLGAGERRQVQADLARLDFDPRGVDGIFGEGTRAAITNWQQEAGFAQTGYLDAEQVARLRADAAGREAQAEAERQAQAAADDEYWRRIGAPAVATGDLEGIQAYLARFPDGRYAEEAADAVALLEAAVRDAAARAEAERDAWAAAREAGTAAAFDRYLAAWPEGENAEEARAARRALAGGDGGGRDAARQAEQALGLTPLSARLVEARLRALGLGPGAVDGTLDGDTRAALRRFQEARDLPATGFLDEATLVRLLADTLGRALGD